MKNLILILFLMLFGLCYGQNNISIDRYTNDTTYTSKEFYFQKANTNYINGNDTYMTCNVTKDKNGYHLCTTPVGPGFPNNLNNTDKFVIVFSDNTKSELNFVLGCCDNFNHAWEIVPINDSVRTILQSKSIKQFYFLTNNKKYFIPVNENQKDDLGKAFEYIISLFPKIPNKKPEKVIGLVQKTFTDSKGKLFEIMEFRRSFTIDSCLKVEKDNPGWKMPDVDQIKNINKQWFGYNNNHIWVPNPKKDYYTSSESKWPVGIVFVGSRKYMQDIPGSIFLTSSKLGDGIYYKAVMLSGNLTISGADEESMGYRCYYGLLLIRPKD